jgi:hypothetical protein
VKIVQVLPSAHHDDEDEHDNAGFKAPPLSPRDRFLKIKHRLLNALHWFELIFITLSMAASETTSKVVLVACTFSFVAGVTLDLSVKGGVVETACFGFVCLVFLAATTYFTWQVEDMERIAGKYRTADGVLRLEELKEQERAAASSGTQHSNDEDYVPPLGPHSVIVENLLQVNPDASSLLWLIKTAKYLSTPFEVKVLRVLHKVLLDEGTSAYPIPTSSLKAYDRAYEKALLDYKKNCRFLKDMLRGSIICENLNQLQKVWQRLQLLQEESVLKILQVKNRFRGSPFPTGYRDLNCNVEFEGFICEIQLHCAAHYVLKDEQHKAYRLCRSLGLMGNTDGNEGAMVTADVAVLPSPKIQRSVSCLRSLTCNVALITALCYGVSGFDHDPFGTFDPDFKGLPLFCKTLSICFPCWIVGGMFLIDMWKDSIRGFVFTLVAISSFPILAAILLPFSRLTIVLLWAVPVSYVVPALTQLRYRDTDNATPKMSRVACLYHKYFSVDGEYFALKSIALQWMSVLLQSQAKLLSIGMVVADGVTEGWYWTFFGVLLMNCTVPSLLLSSEQPWLRREGAMLFDVGCDLYYIGVFLLFMCFHQGNIAGILPTDVVPFSSNLLPMVRMLSISRILMTPRRDRQHQENACAAGNARSAAPPQPSKLTPIVALCFACLSLLTLAAVVCSKQGVYPWNTNPCRPCECSADRVLERCEYDGSRLFLASRGITGLLPGAFVGGNLPHLREVNLGANALTTVENGTFTHLPSLRVLYLYQNHLGTTSWFLGSFFPSLRGVFVPSEHGLASIQADAFANNTQLELVSVIFNSISSVESLDGILTDSKQPQVLLLFGNSLTCNELTPVFYGACF